MTVHARTALALFVAATASAASAQTQTPRTTTQAQEPISVSELKKALGDPVTMTASVAALDYDEKVVVLRDDQGKDHALYVGNDVKRLKDIKVGDKVKITYYMSLASRVIPPGENPSGSSSTSSAIGTAGSTTPGGTASLQERRVVTVNEVNYQQHTLTVTSEKGRTFTFKAEDPARLATVKPGDRIEVIFTAAAVINVERMK
jgi:hypothetical protein